ncbi:hypothetical protein FRC05_005090 [Tulasnella sp. 425]|nr:hypothetical protein FRC05_005090 [Tulasnella sp. 425]
MSSLGQSEQGKKRRQPSLEGETSCYAKLISPVGLAVKDFRGKSGAECENFIKSIRKAAWKEGKLRDALWMADLASLHFSGKALKWHSDLPLDVRQDWFKQEMALLEHWPPPADASEEEPEGAIVPTPAAASLLPTQAGESSDIGVMQFVPISGNEESMYIAGPDPAGRCKLTKEAEKAIRLRWDLSGGSGTRVLEWVVGQTLHLYPVGCAVGR